MKKIPDGFTSVTPYIVFDDTAASMAFYKKSLGAEETISLPNADGTLLYAEIQIGTARLMMGPPCPESGGTSAATLGGSPICFYVYVDDIETAFQKAKQAGMTEKKAPEDMPWGDRMGTLTDPFGLQWTLAQHLRDVSPEEMKANMAALENA